jgi:hypothetical protein
MTGLFYAGWVTHLGKTDKAAAAQLFSPNPFPFVMKYLIFPALLGLGLAGCSQSSQSSTATDPASSLTAMPPASEAALADSVPTPAPSAAATAESSLVASQAPAVATPARSVAYQGDMNLEVDDFDQTTASLNQLLDQFGAYPSTAHEARANGQRYQELTIKVPATGFLHLVAALGKLGRTANKEVSSTDITADLVALSTRVSARQATATKYHQLLAKATNPTQIRQLEEQNRQLQTELAADKGRLQQLGLGVQGLWATLHLRYAQTLPLAESNPPLPSFAPQFLASFTNGWSFVLSILVAVTNLWPLLVLGAIAWPALRWWRRRHPAEY